MTSSNPQVAVIMGSSSDWDTMKHACIMLDQFHVDYTKQVISAHRTPELMADFAHHARENGIKIIIAGAGGAAHLPGMVAAQTGTAISLACGLAKERDMTLAAGQASQTRNVIAIIGDGALSSGVAFEGLNNAAEQGGNLIIICNDNEMSIAENHGGMYANLAQLRATHGMSERNIFRDFGLDYRYVEDGNNVHAMIEALQAVANIDHPIVLHVHTTKGLGMDEQDATQ